ncbi:Soluble aldose sugar dehydrogenase YliI [Kibdelosporangium sp. 4NS15]|uniref:Soluble aldose sugar dehydrogenase YliI n=1 Tax=Kibdelosporangium persicum TaxID=2698649 RepID=A0ABX2FE23_9PSEU|nr:cellulose binding domain-containing protein [Kibdelosporangium persicum]NRN69612.1 Soluble aldose sugar dehydrogenase YliI [Kibdelosporangium persicum]
MSVVVVLGTLVGVPAAAGPQAAPAAPARIMPLGDSITAGPGCWRALLWDRLQRNGYSNIDFVGTQPGGGCAVPHDGDHEGHGGYLATGIANQNQLPAWLSATRPDIVLMHLGTNDVWNAIAPETILTAYSKLVDQMRASNPAMKIVVAQIIPMQPSGCSACAQRVVALNNAIPAWAAEKTTAQSPIAVVDQWTGFNAATDTYDGVHPIDSGFQKMSDRWYPAVTAALGGTNPPPPGSCVATYRVIGQWNGSFQGEVSVRNNTTAATSSWSATLSFTNGQRISQSWNATVTQNAAEVSARNLSWNGGLPPGGSATFGFLASWSGTNDPPAVQCTVTSVASTAAYAGLADIAVTTTQVAFGLRRPTAISAPNDGSGRLFISEKSGTVRIYHPATGLADAPLLTIQDRVSEAGNERGLLGIAVSPAFADDQTIYLAYTRLPDNAVTLGRYRLTDNRFEELLSQEHATYPNHNGGQLAFGPDGLLFWGIGDGGDAGDPFRAGQRLDTLLGKIVRLDVGRSCDGLAYCVPPGNPFVGVAGARAEIWAYGLRNPWRFSVDPADGSLWIGDVGQGAFEEIDHLAATAGGANLGWSCREGPQVFDATRCEPGAVYTDPVFSYPTSTDGCAVIGGVVYRGARYTDLAAGTYLASDYCSNPAWALRKNADGTYSQARIGELPIQVTSFGTSADGEIYLINDLPGQLHQVGFVRTVDCSVAYKVESQWGNGFTASVTVTNNGTTAIDGWTLRWPFTDGQQVGNGWNATVTQNGQAVSAVNANWNARIEPGASVTFGFLASRAGPNSTPAGFTLNDSNCR